MSDKLASRLRQAAAKLEQGKVVAGLIRLLEQAADALEQGRTASLPLSPYLAVPSEDAEGLVLEADGGSRGNPGPAGAGAVLRNQHGLVLHELSKFLGLATNNVAEYQALIMGLEAAVPHNPKKLLIKLDSELLVKQLNGSYQVRSELLKPLHGQARSLLARFRQTEIVHIARGQNQLADALANRAMDAGQ